MDKYNIPTGKKEAEIYLLAYQRALLDLCADIEKYKMTEVYQVNGHAFNVIEEIDEKIESGDYHEMTSEQYELEANLDHMTENQFNGSL